MTESEALDVVAVRVIESADQDRSVWSDADRAWASHEAAAAVGEAAEPGVFLAHRRRQALLETAKQFAEAAIAVTVGMDAAVFLPEDQKRHARLLQLDRKLSPFRLLPSPLALLDPGAGEKTMFERIVGQLAGQGPGQAR